LTVALGLSACGGNTGGPHVADANNIGGYVTADQLTYQLQQSRILNPYSVEDSEYVKGLSTGTPPLTPSEYWYGVFLWAENQSPGPLTTTDNFVITDTQGIRYYPTRLNPEFNPFAWTAQRLYPLQTEPLPGTVASNGPTQGGLLLFRITDNSYANRPLTLHILGSSNQTLATISLDL
jgi:hypothetical protein